MNRLLAIGFALVAGGFPLMMMAGQPRLVFLPYFGITILGLLYLRGINDRR